MKWKQLNDGSEEISVMKKTMSVYLFLNEYIKDNAWEAWFTDESGTTFKLIAKAKSKDKVREKAEAWLIVCAKEILANVEGK
jgi:hypothetical protein